MAGKKIEPGQTVEINGVMYTTLSDWGTPNCEGCDLKNSENCDEYDCLSGVYFVKKEAVNENMLKLFGSHL